MPWKKLRRISLRSSLALLLLPALLAAALVNLRMTDHDALEAANAAYDRSLLGALKSIDANISTASGGLSVELPYRMFEFFELTASGAVYFRVATLDGLVELGSADLPMPPAPLRQGMPVFYDAEYFGESVRLVAYQRKLDRPLPRSAANELLIQVGESTRSRQQFTSRFVSRAVARDAVVLLAMLVYAALAMTVALRPLAVLAKRVRERKADDLTPLPAGELPADILPLVAAVNQQMQRTQTLVSQQREFLDDASHQLRTHLTTLQLQVGYALREQDVAQIQPALQAIRKELGEASRSTHQLLTLARSDTAAVKLQDVDLAALIREVVMDLMPRAGLRGIDLGVTGSPVAAKADVGLLREALLNLVANAIDHTPAGGAVTVSAAADAAGASLNVEDNGPGLSAAQRENLGRRFVRGQEPGKPGTGLGLAIARSIAQRHGGVLRLEAREGGAGLHAILWWPRSATQLLVPDGGTT